MSGKWNAKISFQCPQGPRAAEFFSDREMNMRL
jgi:hypothetical protein